MTLLDSDGFRSLLIAPDSSERVRSSGSLDITDLRCTDVNMTRMAASASSEVIGEPAPLSLSLAHRVRAPGYYAVDATAADGGAAQLQATYELDASNASLVSSSTVPQLRFLAHYCDDGQCANVSAAESAVPIVAGALLSGRQTLSVSLAHSSAATTGQVRLGG